MNFLEKKTSDRIPFSLIIVNQKKCQRFDFSALYSYSSFVYFHPFHSFLIIPFLLDLFSFIKLSQTQVSDLCQIIVCPFKIKMCSLKSVFLRRFYNFLTEICLGQDNSPDLSNVIKLSVIKYSHLSKKSLLSRFLRIMFMSICGNDDFM